MALCVFEDSGVVNLEPLSLTRPAFELYCGAGPLLERHKLAFGAPETGVVVRPNLAALCRLQHNDLAVNDPDWLRRKPTVLVNARWLPPSKPTPDPKTPGVGYVGENIAYVVLPAAGVADLAFETVEEVVGRFKKSLPRCDAGGSMIAYPWELVDFNPQSLREDATQRKGDSKAHTKLAVIGPREQLLVDPSAIIDPLVVADTRNGPVIIDRDVAVHSFSRLDGPCYVGPESVVLGAKLRGGTIGTKCRIGGEVECSIVQGYSNKYHDGFLGHSYVGEWVNLAAGTQTSDLRNDYGPIKVSIGGVRIASGRNKIGSFIGDHTKTGLNTLFNCGSSVGAFCNLLPTGTYLPAAIPSFTLCGDKMTEQIDLRKLFQIASIVMQRRGCEFTDVHNKLYTSLFETTSELRHQLHRDHEQRRLRGTA